MNQNVRDAMVTGFEPLISTICLTAVTDRHVVAAAIHSGAEAIITYNLKDFPDDIMSRWRIKAIHPDDFISDLFHLDSAKVLQAASSQRRSLKNPILNIEDYLSILTTQRLHQTAALLKRYPFAL